MKITVFTSNQPRHINLVNLISEFAEETYAVLESNTLFPGLIQDFYNSSPTMQEYMMGVRNAEAALFGKSRFVSSRAKTLVMKSADLNYLTQEHLKEALQSDIYVVFGSSFIKGWLIDFLIENSALNIHMGLSPYYRGSSCNFWAIYDLLPNYVGATIHYLSKGLDSGPIIFHSVPKFENEDPFAFTMKAVKKAQEDLVYFIKNLKQFDTTAVDQNRELQLRYTRNSDFTDEVAREFLDRKLSRRDLETLITNSKKPDLINLS
jgi:folate-dependent phosphoribosylglycinamide formyltransferase PurN